MWLSSETYHAGSNSPITPTCNHLHNHLRQGEVQRCLFTHKWSSRCWPSCIYKGIGFQEELPPSCFLTIWSLQTHQGAHIWPAFDPFNLFSWRIHFFSRPRGIWCCLRVPKEKVTPYSKPPCDVTWPQLCPVGPFGCFFFCLSMLLKITGILNWLFKLCWFSVWLLPVKTSL